LLSPKAEKVVPTYQNLLSNKNLRITPPQFRRHEGLQAAPEPPLQA
jgi:hypothetical protein